MREIPAEDIETVTCLNCGKENHIDRHRTGGGDCSGCATLLPLPTEEVLPMPTMPELEEIPVVRAPFELWATIKKSSKYYHQGLADPTNRKSKPVPFKIQMVLMTDIDSYDFKGGPGGAYRREDLQLLIKCDGKFKRI